MGNSLLVLLFVAVVSIFIFVLFRLKKKLTSYERKYQGLIDVDAEIAKKQKAFLKEERKLQKKLQTQKENLEVLKGKYQKALSLYEELNHHNKLLQDDLEIAEFGIYSPHFAFDTSEKFKEQIKTTRNSQKALIKQDTAVQGGEGWTVNNSVAEGKKMIRKQKKLMLRAFNGECDSFISAVSWNNISRLEERMAKSLEAINKMGETQRLVISRAYFELKVHELRLTYEYQLKKQQEKEEQRRIKEQMREEEKAKRDFEKAQKEAAKEEKLLQQAMRQAEQAVTKASAEERLQLETELEALRQKLKEAEEKNQRAVSMAQQTKSGHVYVISNIGSFGEDVYKIGMTRRLEPLDRVNELGDASVPFKFDVHAMIYSENAPELENTLHKAFENYRVNFVNRRREYFRLSLSEIEKVVQEHHGEIEFLKEHEAKEYRESLAIREQQKSDTKKTAEEEIKYQKINTLFDV